MNLNIWANQERGRGLLLAKAIAVKPPTVSDWITGKKAVPLERCMPIERATGGQVTRRDLRPDDYLIHWPELAQEDALAVHPAPIADLQGNEVVITNRRTGFIRRADDRDLKGV